MEDINDESRKGPWTEQEDVQLVFYVNLFGDRRWDFIAKVSGLKRTGKSCRLRWVNYLHPGLKRGKMTPHEERLVLELHSKWGNRWSRIARKLPGRTDNEIKNYWRTHMRKKAQERKKGNNTNNNSTCDPSSSSSSSSSSTSNNIITAMDTGKDTDGGAASAAASGAKKSNMEIKESSSSSKVYSLDEIWKDIDELSEESCYLSTNETVPIWDYCPINDESSSLMWSISNNEESKMQPMEDYNHFQSYPFTINHMIGYLEI